MTTASTIPVHCSHTELADVVKLIPNPRNPNKHPDKQIALLAKIIRHQGWRSPVVISNRSGFVVKGHGRLGGEPHGERFGTMKTPRRPSKRKAPGPQARGVEGFRLDKVICHWRAVNSGQRHISQNLPAALGPLLLTRKAR